MCGICGIIGINREEATKRVTTMCRALAHRGPDDEYVVSGSNWALGQRRLSIIDLSQNGRQPFVNEDGSCFLTSNGEIYNYRDLRPNLLKAGHRFVSGSDCEVILHILEQEGERGILKLNGMFAFAFIDLRRRKLLLCRDRVGIKPLYFRKTTETLSFASEIKALVGAPADLNRDHLREFFQYRYLSGSDTLFQGIQEVLPGHVLSIDLDTLDVEDHEYWVPRLRNASGSSVSERDLGREIEQAVARQLVSDVPVGCQLSGGLDSSLVTKIAMRQLNEPMHTFSVGLNGHAEDESSWAELVSGELGTIHHAIYYEESDFLEDLATCTWLNDDPLNHPNSVAMFKMCREAKRHVTVLMTGEGADELFGGYTWHKRLWRLRRIGRLAQSPFIRQLVKTFPKERWAPILPLLGKSPREMASVAGQWVSDESIRDFVYLNPLPPHQYRCELPINVDDPLMASLDLDFRTYLVSVLQRQDRMSMASGVESRVPFLDFDLVDFALKIPVQQLFEGKRGKAILRHVAAGQIPNEIINRPKCGFSMPMATWMRNDNGLGGLLGWLCDERADSRHIWKIDPMRQLVDDHRSGRADNSTFLWSILSFEVWARIWFDGTPHEKLKEQIQEQTRGALRSQAIAHRPQAKSEGQSLAKAGSEGCAENTIETHSVPSLNTLTRQHLNNSSPPAKVPLRICHIVTSLRIGGMERMVCDLMGGLEVRGIKSVVFCTDEKGELYEGSHAVTKFCGHREPRLFVVDWKLLLQIRRFVRDNNIDVIHAHNHAPHLYGAILSFFKRIPLIATRHGQGYNDKWRVRFLKHFLAGKTSTVVLVSKDAKRVSLENHSLSKDDSMTVIPNGINTKLFSPSGNEGGTLNEVIDLREAMRLRLGIPRDAIVIGSVGRLSPEKNYSLLVRAFARLVNRYPLSDRGMSVNEDALNTLISPNNQEPRTKNPPYLMLVGDGADRPVIEAEIDRLKVKDRCQLVGMQGDVLPWLRLMDIFCLSSDTEGLSISLLEAGACGLPSVVTDAGGNQEIVVDGVSGLVVPVGDEVALSAGFEIIVGNESLRREMGAAARKLVEDRFSLDAMVDSYVQTYKSVLTLDRCIAKPGICAEL